VRLMEPSCHSVEGELRNEERPYGCNREAGPEMRLRLPLVREPAVKGALVGIAEARKHLLRLREAGAGGRTELVAQREPEDAEPELLLGVDGEHVAADALGLRRLVQLAVAVGLPDGGRDAGRVNALDHVLHGAPSSRREIVRTPAVAP